MQVGYMHQMYEGLSYLRIIFGGNTVCVILPTILENINAFCGGNFIYTMKILLIQYILESSVSCQDTGEQT
jgi:hypothetical protein